MRLNHVTLGTWVKGEAVPTLESQRDLADFFRVDPAEIEALLPVKEDPDLVPVWEYRTLGSTARLAGGPPFPIATGVHSGTYRVSSPEERTHLFQLFVVYGDCMAPKIEGGDRVVVDTSRANEWRIGDTVAVAHEGALLVKEVIAKDDGGAVLAAIDGTTIRADNDTRVLGVVVEIRKKP